MDLERELQEAIHEINEGDKAKAREIVRNFIKVNPKNEMAWWIYAKLAENIEQRIYCLEKVVDIKPDFKNAKDQLQTDRERINVVPSPESTPIDKQKESKERSKPLLISTIFLAIIVVGLSSYIVYSDFLLPLVSNSSQRNQDEEQSLEENENSYENLVITKFALVDNASLEWDLRLTEGLSSSEYSYITSYGHLADSKMRGRELDIEGYLVGFSPRYFDEFENELLELANLAKPLADAYLEAEITLGGYDPDVENKIPYEKVLSCLEARSLYFNYVHYFFRGDNEKAYPDFNPNACDRFESYYDKFILGLSN